MAKLRTQPSNTQLSSISMFTHMKQGITTLNTRVSHVSQMSETNHATKTRTEMIAQCVPAVGMLKHKSTSL